MAENVSLAVWCRSKAPSASTEMEVHFNYWHIAGDAAYRRTDRKKTVDFIEIGVLIDDPSQVEQIKVFAPLKLKEGDVTDCSQHFQTADIAQGIFNELLRGAGPASVGPKCIELLRSDNSTFARVHSFLIAEGKISGQELKIECRDGGTLLTIEQKALNDAAQLATKGTPAYFRLRMAVERNSANPLIRKVPTPDKWFQSGYDEIAYLDFRLNEARTLPVSIESEMRNEKAQGIRTRIIALLAAIPVQSEISVSNTPSHKRRLLEHDLWKTYMPGGIPDGMIVYHWKQSIDLLTKQNSSVYFTTKINDFTAFVKLSTHTASKKTLVLYLAIAFLFGVSGNIAANYVQKGIDDIAAGRATAASGNTAGS